jgi:hypothetical protein
MNLGFVYAISNMGLLYIGSTKSIHQRKTAHKKACAISPLPLYSYIRENGGWEQFKMEVLEEYRYETIQDLRKRERHWIEERKPLYNQRIPTRSWKERYSNNKDEIIKRIRQNQLNHIEEHKAYQKQYRDSHKDKAREYMRSYMRTYKKNKINL